MRSNIQSAYPIWAGVAALLIVRLITQSSPEITVTIALFSIFVFLGLVSPLTVWIIALVLSPLRVLIQTELSLKLPLDIGQISLAAFALFWLMHATLTRRSLIPLRWTWLAFPLATFIGATILSLFVSASLSVTIIEIIKWLTILVMALLTFKLAFIGYWRLILFALVLSGLASSLIGIYTFLGGSGALHLLIGDRFFRAFGTFGQPNPFGGFMGLILPLALVGCVIHVPHKQKALTSMFVFYGTATGLIAIGLLMSWSRGAWLGTLVAIGIMVFAYPRSLARSLLAAAILVFALVSLTVLNVVPRSITERISSSTAEFFAFEDMRGVDISTENYAVIERLAHWQAALNIAVANPAGVGLGNYETVYDRYRLLNWRFPLGHAHNYYLNVLTETGIVGLLSYLFFIAGTLYTGWVGRVHPSSNLRWLVIGALGSMTYLVFHSLLDNLFVNNVFIHIGTIIGLIYFASSDATRTIPLE